MRRRQKYGGGEQPNTIEIPAAKTENLSLALNEIKKYADNLTVTTSTPEVLSIEDNTVMALKAGSGKLKLVDNVTTQATDINVTVGATRPFGFMIKSYDDYDFDYKVVPGATIDDYMNNHSAFNAVAETGATVKVNGENADSKKGFYKNGTYDIEVEKNGESHTFRAIISPVPEDKANYYDIVVVNASLPPLYAALDIVKHDNEKFIWYERTNTFATDVLEADKRVTLSRFLGNKDKYGDIVKEVKSWVIEKCNNDTNAKFRLYVADYQHWVEINTLCELGFNPDRYDVYYCSDGTLTYYGEVPFAQGIFASKQQFEASKNMRDIMVDKARSNAYLDDLHDYYLVGTENYGIYYHNEFIWSGAYEENIHFWMQYPEFMRNANSEIEKILQNAGEKKLPEQMYKELTDKEKSDFLKLVNFDKAEFDKTYFNADNGKPYLIISGRKDHATTIQYIDKILPKYKDEYNIVFKPHPRGIPSGDVAQQLADRGIKVLPGQLPMEVLLFVYPENKIGGYSSSLYMSAPKGNTLFFFANNKDAMPQPIPLLYDSLFPNAEFITLS